LLENLAQSFNLSYNAFGKDIQTGEGPKYGTLVLSDAWGTALEPAPVTPTGKDAAPYQLLSGSIKAAYDAYYGQQEDDVKEIFVAPGIMSGNTGMNSLHEDLLPYHTH
jgi:Gly-Xaa carboxypeptidase